MAFTNKEVFNNLIADSNQFCSDSEDFQPNFIEHSTERLYKRILYGIEKSTENEAYKNELQNYAQAAFNITHARHSELLREVIQLNPVETCLNIGVFGAQQLDTKNVNGFANPFVTMHIESLALNQCTTTVKSNTLNPLWEEQFSLPLTNDIDNENLIVQVWHFNSIGTMREKIKSPRHFGKFIKKIAAVSSGSHDHELIGRCNIPLKAISTVGSCKTYCLYKNDKPKSRGTITLQLSFGTAVLRKSNNTSHQDRKNLLRILLLHELKMSRIASHSWLGQFGDLSKTIIAYSGHTANAHAHTLAQWSAFTTFHTMHPLPFRLFENLLMDVLPLLKGHEIDTKNETNQIFWDGVKKLLPSCFMAIRNNLRENDTSKKMITESLSILSVINTLTPPNDIDLFPRKIYGWLDEVNDDPDTCSCINRAVEEAIRSRAQDYLLEITEFRFVHQENIESNLKNIIKVMELIESDLQQSASDYSHLFREKMHCDYAAICYVYYANEIAECFEMTIKRTCEHLMQTSVQINIDGESSNQSIEHESIPMGIALFDVYLALKRFAEQSVQYCWEVTQLKIHDYQEWFANGVSYWLDMHHLTAFKRIKRAIDMDKLLPIDDMTNYSTSAVDTIAIFHTIKEFWLHLSWPDVENAYTFMAKIVDDICHCAVYYAEKMTTCAVKIGENENEHPTYRNLCLVLNNIGYLRENFTIFTAELNVDEIISKLAIYRSHADAQRCQQTLKNIMEDAVDTIENLISKLIEHIAYKMCTQLHKCLWQVAESLHQDSHLIDRLIESLEKSLVTFSTNLDEMNFKQILFAVWKKFKIFFSTLLQNCLDTQCAVQFYSNLHECLQIIIKCFKCYSDDASQLIECNQIAEFQRILRLHSRETEYLIQQYYIHRYKQQLKMKGTPFGQLTIRANSTDDHFLELEILNARNLVSNEKSSLLDPFVEVKFSPKNRNSTNMKLKTATQFKTLFPLFDEKFVIPIHKKQRTTENYLIIFSIKNHDRFGILNKYIAECFITFEEIQRSSPNDQIHLTLSIPTSMDDEYLKVLKLRESDKIAKKFIKNLKRKLSSLAK